MGRRRKRVVKEVEQHESHIFARPTMPARPPRAGEDHDLGAPGGADYRMQCFALMAWLRDYRPLLQMESAADGELQQELQESFVSGYADRMIRKGSERGDSIARKLQDRVRDAAGTLQRSKNVHYIPFSQAVKAVSFLFSRVNGAVWAAELRNRRVVCKAWAQKFVREMARCKPPPPFEEHAEVYVIGFDQTYARGAGRGGVSRYRPEPTIDADGEKVRRRAPRRTAPRRAGAAPSPPPLLPPPPRRRAGATATIPTAARRPPRRRGSSRRWSTSTASCGRRTPPPSASTRRRRG